MVCSSRIRCRKLSEGCLLGPCEARKIVLDNCGLHGYSSFAQKSKAMENSIR